MKINTIMYTVVLVWLKNGRTFDLLLNHRLILPIVSSFQLLGVRLQNNLTWNFITVVILGKARVLLKCFKVFSAALW